MEKIPFYYDIRFWAFAIWAFVVVVGVILLKHYDNECSVYLTIMCVIQIIIQALIFLFLKVFED